MQMVAVMQHYPSTSSQSPAHVECVSCTYPSITEQSSTLHLVLDGRASCDIGRAAVAVVQKGGHGKLVFSQLSYREAHTMHVAATAPPLIRWFRSLFKSSSLTYVALLNISLVSGGTAFYINKLDQQNPRRIYPPPCHQTYL